MNESSIHIFTLLYQETGEPRYMEMAQAIERDWEVPPSGDYVREALAGKAFHQMPKPRWESLHGVQAIAEMYWITGEARYREAFERIWWSIVEGDRHNTGGFSSGEMATGNPYDTGAIETCCTVAWMALTVDQLRLTGDSRAADELELSTWNGALGAQNASGRWWTYNTPMDGERRASAHDIVFQARAGSPELNCCAMNGPRALGLLSEWAVMAAPGGIALNYYGPSMLALDLPAEGRVTLQQETAYPFDGRVRLTVTPESMKRFALRLRVPGWSSATRIDGEIVNDREPGAYIELDREWVPGDTVEIAFDMDVWAWVGERESAGKVALYRGPVLLAYDPRFDVYDPTALPELDLTQPPVVLESAKGALLRVRFATREGGTITLCDFASAGAAGDPYASWLPAPGLDPVPFSRRNPLRTRTID
jgi:hypothetical protein